MSDHDFEKQVRQKLDDLRISPSARLWENIEHGLRAGRRRKAPILWLSLLLLVVAAGGYWMYDNGERENALTSENKTVTSEIKKVSPESTRNKQKLPEPTERATGNKNGIVENKAGPENKIPESENKGRTSEVTRRINKTGVISVPEVAKSLKKYESKTFQQSRTSNTKPGTYGIGKLIARDLNSNLETKGVDLTNATIDSKQLQLHALKVSTASDSYNKAGSIVSKLPSGQTPGVEMAMPPPVKLTPEKRWSFGVNGFTGITTMNDGNIFNLGETKVADLTRSAPPTNAFAPSYTPSKISPGFSYAAGLFVKRTLNKRFSLTSGINYLHLNTKHNVGKRIYGALAVNVGNSGYQFVNNAFVIPQGEVKNYTNTYHFIEVPLILNTKLNKSAKYPVHWNAGVAYSRLLSSNSLLFDGSSGLYYSNDKLLKKSHAALMTGFDVALFSKTKTPVSIGPLVRYNVSKLLNEDIPENKNFLSIGLDVKLFLR